MRDPLKALARAGLSATAATIMLLAPYHAVAPAASAQTTAPTPIDLNGEWVDGAYKVTIAQSGTNVTASYLDAQTCDLRDDTGGTQPYPDNVDFTATLVDGELTGTTNACHWGTGNPHGIGVFEEPIHLTVSADGSTLSGIWQGQNGPESMSVTRVSKRAPDDSVCGDLQNQLDHNQRDLGLLGPQMDQQLQSAFQQLGVAATQAGAADAGGDGQLAQEQLVATAGDILTLRNSLDAGQAQTFFADPRWTTLLVLDAANVEAAAQLTDGQLVAVPTTIMDDLVRVMARGADDATSNDSLMSELAAQGCAGHQA